MVFLDRAVVDKLEQENKKLREKVDVLEARIEQRKLQVNTEMLTQ